MHVCMDKAHTLVHSTKRRKADQNVGSAKIDDA